MSTNFATGVPGTVVEPYFINSTINPSTGNGNIILARCTVANLPTGQAGYAIGCDIQASDTGAKYVNTGTAASATWTLLEDAGGTFTLPTSATDATTTTGNSFVLNQNAITTGIGSLQTVNGLTTGFGRSITHTTAVIAAGGSLDNISSTSIDTSTTTGILQNLSSTASVVGTQRLLTASALTTGIADSVVVAALTTGIGNKVTAAAATLTTGRYYSANDGALEVFGVGANGHLHTTQTTAPTVATNSTGISAVAVTAGSTDVCGTITTTGTPASGTVLTITFNKTYTTAPKFVTVEAANAAAGGVNTPPIVTQTATTIVLTWPAGGVYAATPSFTYFVIA